MTTAAATSSQTTAPASASAAAGETVTIETRFGAIDFDRATTLTLPHGMMGFAEFQEYGLANLPDPRLAAFKLLQCLSEPSLSFIVVHQSPDGARVSPGDLEAAFDALGVAKADRATLYAVAVRRTGDQVEMSINLRAPILIDTRRQLGRQYVLPNNAYAVRHRVAQPDFPTGQATGAEQNKA
ncbi:MAG: flagellar assembly protein FliW [Alphaproteobacteria bacterium]